LFKTQKGLAHHYWQRHASLPNETKKRNSNQFLSGKQTQHRLETRAKLSDINCSNPVGIAINPSLRSYAGRSKHYEVVDSFGNPVILQSSWEYEMMNQFNQCSIRWRRGMTFWLSMKAKTGRPCSYTPDFWLPDYDVYVDPKARENAEQAVRIECWLKQYNKKLLIIRNKVDLTWAYVHSQIPLL
jgi:hypothetical protein